MAARAFNFVISLIKSGVVQVRNHHLWGHRGESVFKPLIQRRAGKRSVKPGDRPQGIVIEHGPGVDRQAVQSSLIGGHEPGRAEKVVPPRLPEDLISLAAQNSSFKQGILHLQALNLDDDLFIEAVEALRAKYYARRFPLVSWQPPDRYLPRGETLFSDGDYLEIDSG
ncbi:MAG: hypothetical protein ACK2UK_03750 [Candidatus Promineifilaceae bacterium]|jgi:hypothetical protein